MFFLLSVDFFFQKISGTVSECQMVWIQVRTNRSVGPDLGSNCLQRLSSRRKFTKVAASIERDMGLDGYNYAINGLNFNGK